MSRPWGFWPCFRWCRNRGAGAHGGLRCLPLSVGLLVIVCRIPCCSHLLTESRVESDTMSLQQLIAMMDPGVYENRKQVFGDVGPWPGRMDDTYLTEKVEMDKLLPGLQYAIASGGGMAGVLSGEMGKALRSGRAGGAFKDRLTKVSQYVEQNVPKDQEVLDFGAGYHGVQTRKLSEKGFKVTAFDLPENMQKGIHDPEALKKQYPTVMASNVLNVQPNKDSLTSLLDILRGTVAPGGQVVANYPKSPRHANFSDAQMLEMLREKFSVEKLKDLFLLR